MEDVQYWKKRALEAEARAEKLRREISDLRMSFSQNIHFSQVAPSEPLGAPAAGKAATSPNSSPRPNGTPLRTPNSASPRNSSNSSPMSLSTDTSSSSSPRRSPHKASPTTPSRNEETPMVVERAFRFILLGAPGVGRTSLIGRFCADQRLDGVIIHSEHDEVSPLVGISDHVIQIFSPRIITSLVTSYSDPFFRAKFEGISVAIVVYDSTDRATFRDLCTSFELQINPLVKANVPIVIVGNKSDIDDDRDVDPEKARAWAAKRGFGTLLVKLTFIETSALSGKCAHEILWNALQKALTTAVDVPPITPLSPRICGIPTFSLIASYLSAKERIQKVSIVVEGSHTHGELWFPFGRECESKIDDILREMRQTDLSIEDGALKGVSLTSLIDTAVNESTGHIVDVRVLFASLRVIGKDTLEILKLFVEKFRSSHDLNERLQCLGVIRTWIQEYRIESKTKEIDRFLVTFLRSLLALQPEISDEVHKLLRMVDKRLRPTKGLKSLHGVKIPNINLSNSGSESDPGNSASQPDSSSNTPTSTPAQSPLPSPRSVSGATSKSESESSPSKSEHKLRGSHTRNFSLNFVLSSRSSSSPSMPSPRGRTPSPRLGHPLLDFINIDLARQIAQIDREMFQKLTILELTSFKWSKNGSEVPPNPVTDISTRFNNLSNWVATVIVSTESQKLRIKLVKKFWKVAKCLRELGDFHSLMALVAGLTRGPCQRLKKTMEAILNHRVYHAIQLELTALCDAKSRFASLREAMASFVGPYIPYLGLTLSDLVICDEGNPDRVDNLINWGKCVLIYNKAAQLINAIEGYPTGIVVPEIRAILTDLKPVDDNTLYDIADYMENKRRSRTGSNPPIPEGLPAISKSHNPYEHQPPKASPRSMASIFGRTRAMSSGNLVIQGSRSSSQSEGAQERVSSSSSPVPLSGSQSLPKVAEKKAESKGDKKREDKSDKKESKSDKKRLTNPTHNY